MAASQFIALLENRGLLDPEIIVELHRQVEQSKGRVTPEAIAKLLVENGQLTRFQATKLVTELNESLGSVKPDPSLALRGGRPIEPEPTDLHDSVDDLLPTEVVEGATLTAALPLRGNIQIRVEEVTPLALTFATLRGHPLAGVVRFSTSAQGTGIVQFDATVFARAATVFDWVVLHSGGSVAQNWTWRSVVGRVVEISGGTSDSVQEERVALSDNEETRVEEWIRDLISGRKFDTHNESSRPE